MNEWPWPEGKVSMSDLPFQLWLFGDFRRPDIYFNKMKMIWTILTPRHPSLFH